MSDIVTVITWQWQPIETAPRNGALLLVYDAADYAGLFYLARWGKHNHVPIYGWIWSIESFGEEVDGCDPTHWMPLPAPPVPA